ncbi:MAG: cytochrome c3 family protein [Anaerolineae bacterium]
MSWLSAMGLAAVGLLAWGAFGFWGEPAIKQPIEFPHKTHVEMNLECTSCHERAEIDAAAGRPATELCLSCHSEEEAEGELKKLQAFGEKGEEIPWRRVWRLPSHVFFSHRIHVAVAKVKCQTCHGPMETLDRPPPRPLRALSMKDCIGCHEKREGSNQKGTTLVKVVARRASTDCLACHR